MRVELRLGFLAWTVPYFSNVSCLSVYSISHYVTAYIQVRMEMNSSHEPSFGLKTEGNTIHTCKTVEMYQNVLIHGPRGIVGQFIQNEPRVREMFHEGR